MLQIYKLSQQHCGCYSSVVESIHKNALIPVARYYVIVAYHVHARSVDLVQSKAKKRSW